MFKCTRCLVSLAIILTCTSLFAAETGSVSGIVSGGDGSSLPGVTVTITGQYLPGGRSMVTEADGRYTFLRLQPGPYEVAAELAGLGRSARQVVVQVDRDTQANLTLRATVSESITVSAATPVVDVKSTEVSKNFTNAVIENLPVSRDYRGLFQLAPGVADNNRNTPNAGGNRQDNSFYLDGINVTNPFFGDILPNVTELDIQEANIKRGGITAEFGRTGGMVVNAVTKSGTNKLSGEARYEYRPKSWVGDSRIATLQSKTDRTTPQIGIGGPILRDHVWFYASGTQIRDTLGDRVNNLGPIPDREQKTHEYFGKLSASPTSRHFLAASWRTRNSTTENSGIGVNTHPNVATTDSTDYSLGTAQWAWNLTSRSLVEIKANRNRENNAGIPITQFGYRPTFDIQHPEKMGQFVTQRPFDLVGGATKEGQTVGGAQFENHQDFFRDEVRAEFQTLQDWLGMSHDLRAGAGYDYNGENLSRVANGWGLITYNTNTKRFSANYVPQQPPHKGTGATYSLFAQDQATVGERTTVTAGVLLNRDTYYGPTGRLITFGWGDEVQPRLGVSFVPNLLVHDKVYANFGRYYNTDNKSLARAASPRRIYSADAVIDGTTGAIISDAPRASETGKTVTKDLKAMYTDEFVAGYARPFATSWSAEVWGMYRSSHDFIEDVSADGLGNGPFKIVNLPEAFRKYRAVTLSISRAPNARFMDLSIDGSYTWSRLRGNWDLDYAEQLFYSSSILQDGPGVLITDNRKGILTGDRTHVAKLFASVRPIGGLRAGAYLRYQSGVPYQAQGFPSPLVSSVARKYLEPAGSRRTESWFNTDFLASYEIPVSGFTFEIEGRVANAFDKQAVLGVDTRYYTSRSNEANSIVNPAFASTTELSSPRTFILSGIIRY